MNWEYLNEEIHECYKAMGFLNALVIEIDPDHAVVSQDTLDQLNVCVDKLGECATYMPEVTERDLAFDTYWDKRDQQAAAREFGESLENEVRYEVAYRTFKRLYDAAIQALMKADPDTYGEIRCAACEAADGRYDDHDY